MRTSTKLMIATAVVAASPAAARDTASPAAAPAASWSSLRFDLATVSGTESGDRRDFRAGDGVDMPVARRLVASVETDVAGRGSVLANAQSAPTYRREVSATGRLGYVFDSIGMVYGRAGYTQLDTNEMLSLPFGQARAMTGALVGAGSEIRIASDLSLRTEYQFVDYAAADTTASRAIGGLAFRF